MSTTLTTPHSLGAPTPDEVRARVAELVALEARDPTTFAEALADNIVEPRAVDTLAFRDDELAYKSLVATRYLIERTEEAMRRFARDKTRVEGQQKFRAKVLRERRILDNVVNGIRAKKGILPNAPNPRRRAERRLVSEAMRGPVPAGRWRELVNEEIAKDEERKRQAKKARRADRRDGGNRPS